MKTLLRPFRLALCLAVLLSVAASTLHAADVFGPPATVDYQGILKDSSGIPLGNAEPTNYEVQFRIYDAQAGGDIIWAEKQIVTVSGGLFSVRLGEGDELTNESLEPEGLVGHASPGLPGAFGGKERYLGVTVVIPGQTPSEITPRLAFLASPFSFVAARAQSADRVVQDASSQPSSLNLASVSYVPLIVTASAQLDDTDSAILADATAGAVAATLPVLAANKEITVTKNDASAFPVTVVPPGGGGLINGSATPITLVNRGDSVTLRNTDANNWVIVSRYRGEGAVHADTPIEGGILARGGKPGVEGVNHNGYAFSGNGGDNDSGMFSTQEGKIAFFANGVEKVYVDESNLSIIRSAVPPNPGVNGSLGLNLINDDTTGTGTDPNVIGISFGRPGIVRQAIVGGTFGAENLDFYTQGDLTTPKMRLYGDGTLSVGTTDSPRGKLHVSGSVRSELGFYAFYANGGGGATNTGTGAGPNNVGIYSQDRISAPEFNAISDERIKTIKGLSNGGTDLNTLMSVQVTDYIYRDAAARGSVPQKKLIAQQVEKVFPQAVAQSTDIIPDIMKKASMQDGWIVLTTDLKKGEKVRLLADKGADKICEVLEVMEGRFRADFDTAEKEIFVYGREVKDFRTVDYDAVAMLNVSATQQVKTDSDAAEAALRKENSELRKQVAAQHERLATLEKQNTDREARLAALESALLDRDASRTAASPAKVTVTPVIAK